MSDLLEDQKIHYIVRDYQRMFNNYQSLSDTVTELKKTITEKDTEILRLRTAVNELKKKIAEATPQKPSGNIRCNLNNLEARTESFMKTMEKLMSFAQKNINDIEELRKILNT